MAGCKQYDLSSDYYLQTTFIKTFPMMPDEYRKVRNILSAHRIGSRTDFGRVNQGDLTWQGAPGKIGKMYQTHSSWLTIWIYEYILFWPMLRRNWFVLLKAVKDVKGGCNIPIYYLPRRPKTHNILSMYWPCIISHTSQSITRNSLEDIFGQRWLQKIIGQNEKAPFFYFIYFIFFLL